jgi:hypothetical protein
MLTVAGIDVGLSYLEPSSGVCRTGRSGFVLTHTYVDKRSRFDALGDGGSFDVLSVDGPLEPGLSLGATPRPAGPSSGGASQEKAKSRAPAAR